MYGLMILCCGCAYFHGLGSAVQTCPLLIHGAAAGLQGQNIAEGQVVMNGLPSTSPSSLCLSCLKDLLVSLLATCQSLVHAVCEQWLSHTVAAGKRSFSFFFSLFFFTFMYLNSASSSGLYQRFISTKYEKCSRRAH